MNLSPSQLWTFSLHLCIWNPHFLFSICKEEACSYWPLIVCGRKRCLFTTVDGGKTTEFISPYTTIQFSVLTQGPHIQEIAWSLELSNERLFVLFFFSHNSWSQFHLLHCSCSEVIIWLPKVYRKQYYIVKSASRPHKAEVGVCVLIKTLPGQTRGNQYTHQIRQLAACSDLLLLPRGVSGWRVTGNMGSYIALCLAARWDWGQSAL